MDTNFTVCTIFGVWPGDKLHGITGRDQVAAAMGIYGPRTTYVLALKDIPGTHEFILLDEGLFASVKSVLALAKWEFVYGINASVHIIHKLENASVHKQLLVSFINFFVLYRIPESLPVWYLNLSLSGKIMFQ